MTRIFLDANVYFAGFFSRSGASRLILDLAGRGKIRLVASRLVLREADRNLRLKSDPKLVKAFHRFLNEAMIQIVPTPLDSELTVYEALTHPKDVPILAAALRAQVDFLITLDRTHLLTPRVLSHREKTKIVTPAEFIREQIQKHPGRRL